MQSVATPAPASQAERLAAALAAAQRRAARGGRTRRRRALGEAPQDQRPLLVIAGAGSGKTNTLAHRVAHLIARGADPQRILLLTFSRRAAQEMERRAGQVLARVLGLQSRRRRRPCRGPAPSTASARACCASTRRRSASSENFTIHDRGDAEDLMGLVRNDIGLSRRRSGAFRARAPASSIYSRAVNTCAPLAEVLQQRSRGAPSGRPN